MEDSELEEVVDILVEEDLSHEEIVVDMLYAHLDLPRGRARNIYSMAMKSNEYTEEGLYKQLDYEMKK